MHRTKTLRHRLLGAAAAVALLVSVPGPRHALTRTWWNCRPSAATARYCAAAPIHHGHRGLAPCKHMVETTADDGQPDDRCRERPAAENPDAGGCEQRQADLVSGQMQGLNDSVDELKSRMTRLDKSLQDLQGQLQNMQSQPARCATRRCAARRCANPPLRPQLSTQLQRGRRVGALPPWLLCPLPRPLPSSSGAAAERDP